FVVRAETAALHVTLAEAALHVGDYELARREARAALRSAESAWYARDAERTRSLAARIVARADALEGDPARALAASTGADPLAQVDAAAFAALCSADDAHVRRDRAREALTMSEPYDGADAVALWSAAETLDLLDALAGFHVETALAPNPFDGLLARRAEPLRLADLGVALRTGNIDAYERGLQVATARGPRFETTLLTRLARPFLAGRPAPAQRAPGPLEALTAREHEILGLLAAGLTNREIAQRLIVSARTVETHVARITGKLGVNSRARAVARAVALGLVAQAAAVP
ncbi:MAG TPA: helix-turn-helix transcriptional regulator, partial [Candidatus Acidoferrum sp.]|nr:helix-turn-helix transcriptional regulator [Candidatus Acidoferrum sp.]